MYLSFHVTDNISLDTRLDLNALERFFDFRLTRTRQKMRVVSGARNEAGGEDYILRNDD